MPVIKLDNIQPLKGLENYEVWSNQVSLILFAIGAKSIVLSGIVPDDLTAEHAAYLTQQAFLIIIQLVSAPIMAQIANFTNPHEMWAYLKENYYSDTYFSLVHQMQVLFTLERTLDTNRPIGEFIQTFETEWSRMYQLASGTSKYKMLMKQVLEQDEAKRDWLLAALVSNHPNIVDNMTSKDNLSYAQLKLRLHSLASNVNRGNRTAGTALVTKHDRRNNLKGYTTALSCSFCKARNLSRLRHSMHSIQCIPAYWLLHSPAY